MRRQTLEREFGGSQSLGYRLAMLTEVILAIDPGLNIGLALVRSNGTIKHREIITLEELKGLRLTQGALVVVGNGTGSKKVQEVLHLRGCNFTVFDEAGTSIEARELYFNDYPPKGLARLLPRGLRFPARPIDDYAACAIARRFLACHNIPNK
jgi:hypothetical protein